MLRSLKKVFMVVSLLVLVTNIYANDKQIKSLEIQLDNYFDALKKSDVQNMMDYIYEPSFELVSREVLISSYKKMFKDERVPKINDIKKINIQAIKEYKKGFFTKAYYDATLTMVAPSKKEEEIKRFKSILETMLKEKKPEISYDNKTSTFKLKINTFILAINEDDRGWKFVADNFIDNLKQAKLLPEEISNSL